MLITEFNNGELAGEGARIMTETHRLMALLQFYEIVGNADSLRKTSGATGGTNRAINNNFTGQVVDPSFANPTLRIFGDEVKVDQAHERRGQDIVSVRTRDFQKFMRRMTINFLKQVLEGTGSAPQITGLKNLVTTAGKFYADSSSSALTLQLGNTSSIKAAHGAFKEKLQQGIQKVDRGAQGIIIPTPIHHRVSTILDDEVNYTRNEAGQLIATWNGVELIPAGYDNDGNSMITAEQPGTITTDTFPIYFARFGEAEDVTVATSNGLNVTDKGLVESQYIHNVELDSEPALENDKALAKLEGVAVA